MGLSECVEFCKRVRNAFLNGERQYLDVAGLELLPDLFL
ncbi:MAG: hypothetical protein JWL77_6641 [Chthonomonadaceae bacterium]|nr:hypothetical protein [Chthonomonadaceae bacterium]